MKPKNPSPDVELVVLDENDGVVSRHHPAVEHLSAFAGLQSSRILPADLNLVRV